MAKILVLGGLGFIGGNLSTLLEHKGHQVLRLSRATGCDMINLNSLVACLGRAQPAVIFNCAAHVGSLHYVKANPASVITDNLLMAINLYRVAMQVCPGAHIVNLLSNCSYPGDAVVQSEPEWWDGEPHDSVFAPANAKRSLYVISKCYQSQHGIRTSNFILPGVFGPGDHLDHSKTHAIDGLVMRMITAKRSGASRFEVWGSGSPVREWAYVEDVAEILSMAIGLNANLINPVNIAQNHGVTIRESAEAVKSAVQYEGEFWFNTKYEDGAPIKVLDDRRFREIFPTFKFLDHGEAINRTVQYYEAALQ